jgi:hypothetical protein
MVTANVFQGYRMREIRANYSETAITVYQAFSDEIAREALAGGRFGRHLKMDRMTWIKPSFLWMMYRSAWATKPDQERVLAIDMDRSGFEWALANSCLTHFEPQVHASVISWHRELKSSPILVQWDPDRDLRLEPLTERTIQIGIGPGATERYIREWTQSIRDVTDTAHELRALVELGDIKAATRLLPATRVYPLSDEVSRRIGAS